jgi:hypothetical protein
MSKEAALAFLKLASENDALQKKIVALATQEGYTFTVDELTDAELDAAAGGAIFYKITAPAYKVESSITQIPKLDSSAYKLP